MKLIDKDVLVAKIRKRLLSVIRDKHYDEWEEGQDNERIAILKIIDTLEVKDVDLEKEVNDFFLAINLQDGEQITENTFRNIAKHFFELGMCAANPLTAKDIKKIYHLVNEVSDDLGVRAMCVNIYQEALKRFNAQKGE